jgi:hypothetical protein
MRLTHLPPSDFLALFALEGGMTRLDVVELDESIGLLDRYLCQPAKLVKDVEYITLRNLLCWQITCTWSAR